MGKRGPAGYKADWTAIDKMCAIHCTGEEIAAILAIDYDTLSAACKRDHKKKLSDYISEKQCTGKMSLRRKQYTTAMDGNPTMLVWLGKNWLNQTDKLPEDKTNEVDALIKAFAALSGKLPV